MSADFDLRPGSGGSVPPRPAQPPRVGPQQGGRPGGGKTPRSALNVSDPGVTYPSKERARREQRVKTVHKTRNGGGFNPSLNPTISVNVNKGGAGNGAGQAPAGGAGGVAGRGGGTPGADFMSNEDIHKFSEYLRKEGRKRATERAMDAEQLEQVLRTIPDSTGSMAGSRARSRRVSRHLKRIAKAEQLIAKEATAVYASFQREYEAELRKISAARPKQPRRASFNWR